jgi:hypothetical protein
MSFPVTYLARLALIFSGVLSQPALSQLLRQPQEVQITDLKFKRSVFLKAHVSVVLQCPVLHQ